MMRDRAANVEWPVIRRILSAVAGVSVFFLVNTAEAGWKGHSATLSDAQNACRDIDSAACEPYLAEAVAIADLLNEQAKIERFGGEEQILLPGATMSQWTCDLSHGRLNGQSLLHIALASQPLDAKGRYWTQALHAAALQQCKPAK